MQNTTNTHIVNLVESLLQPDTLIAFEYFDALRQKSQLAPEKRLLLAVLEDAVVCFQKHLLAEEDAGKKLVGDAREWIFEENDNRVFSFDSICEILELDPGYFRKRLLLWEEKKRAGDKGPRDATPDNEGKGMSRVFPRRSSPFNRLVERKADGI